MFVEVVGHHGVGKKKWRYNLWDGRFCERGKRHWRMIGVTFLGGVDDGMRYDRRCILHKRVLVGAGGSHEIRFWMNDCT